MKDEGGRMKKASPTSSSIIPTVETARLLLRPLSTSDLGDYTPLIFADAEVMRYLPQRDLAPRERAERTIVFFSNHWSQHGYGVWAVTDKHTGQFIGHCGLNFVPDAGEVEVLYALRKDRWGKGLATEAAWASARFGFEVANLERLIALATPENIASRRVMEHLGFKYEKGVHYFGLVLVYYVLQCDQFHKAASLIRMR
jgi:ribosomal-protein-alanine N-acetyltransferase